jgi:CRP-like cAMP-binding protein
MLPIGENQLLAAIADARERFDGTLRLEELELRTQLYERDQPIDRVVFPIDCVCSMLSEMEDGRSVEVATVGREGMVGLPVFLQSSRTSSHLAFVQVAGRALTMDAEAFARVVEETPQLNAILHRYTLALLGQIAQASACNRLHRMDQRAARWLLLTHDRVRKDRFPLTQDFLAQMLGVPRGRVNEAAQQLQQAGTITYTRGVVTVTDRPGLEAISCECYDIIRREHERLLSPG